MSVEYDSFLSSAKALMDIASPVEIDFRNCISRSYYCAYHTALEFAELKLEADLENVSGGAHIKLSDFLSRYICEDKDCQRDIRRIGIRLKAFHSQRVRSDYMLEDTIGPVDARAQLKNVEEMVAGIKLISQRLAA